jgi:hypothetical protein
LAIIFLLFSLLAASASSAQVNVVTQRNDNGRTGQNTKESLLTPANVNSSQFGLLFALPVDGQVYAQPLYVAGVHIPGSGTHNVVYVATEHDTVYAFDADSNGGANQAPLWQASMLSAAHGAAPGATTVSSLLICDDIVPEYGITGTPVIDPTAGVLYVVSFTEEGASFVLRLHALNIATGAEMTGSPVAIQAQVSGIGNGSSGGVLKFDPKWENQRPGLLLLNGVLYIGFASHADNGDWHGWLLSYNPTTLAQIAALCVSPNGVGSGFWMSGDGLAADVIDPVGHPFGRIFAVTGNGDVTAATPYSNSMDYGDSILGIDLSQGVPTVEDEFTPSNQSALDSADGDLGSGGLVILPDQTGPYPHLLAQEGKGGTLYLINRDKMGGYGATDNVVQEIAASNLQHGVWGGPTYWNGNLYFGEADRHLKAYSLNAGVLTTTPTSTSSETFTFPGPSTSISSLGNKSGILWAVVASAYNTGGAAVLRAYDATNLANELYNSEQVPARDTAGGASKFVVPTVTNGKVYVATGGQVDVYGLFSSEPAVASPVISPGSTSFTGSIQVKITDATPGAKIYYTLDGTAPSTASALYAGPITVNSSETVTAFATAPGYVWIAPVSATYTALNQTANPVFTPSGGTFSTSPTVTIADATPGAAIYYTTDNSTPTNASTRYAGPIAVAGSETIRAIAFAPSLSGSGVVSESYITQSGVDFSEGFAASQSLMTFNGSTGLDDSRLQLTNGYTSADGSAFVDAPLNIQAFTTDFLFQLSNPQADGITFTIQNNAPTLLGPDGQSLGYSSGRKSLAIKFDYYNDQGEGADSTGVYVNGATPTIPAIDLSSTGVNLKSGDLMGVHLTYDGVNLAMIIVDEVTSATWSGVWQVNIPQIVGGNTAYVGFSGSSQILTASQKIATWTFTSTTPGLASTTATPVISPATGTYAKAQTVTIKDSTEGAAIYYTTDGTAPTTASTLYTGPFTVSSSARIQAMAQLTGGAVSGMASSTLAIASAANTGYPNYTSAAGFNYGSLILNGPALVATPQKTKALQLTDGSFGEARSAYFATPVSVNGFTTDFDFQMVGAAAEGLTFVVQNAGLNAVGTTLGYGFTPSATGNAIANSVAVGFDINGASMQGVNVALLYVNGVPSALPATNLTGAGITLNKGDVIHAHIVYDGTNLTLTLTDAAADAGGGAASTSVFPVNIPAAIGSSTAYVGFTGGTSATATADLNILDWTYTVATTPTATPVIAPGSGTFAAPTVIAIRDASPGAVIYYTTDGTAPTVASNVYTGSIPVDVTGTIKALALAPGYSLSAPTSASYTIQTPSATYAASFSSEGMLLNGGADIDGGVLQLTDGGLEEARSAYFATPLNVQAFTTDFDFQLLNASADGFTFTIQNQGPTAIGGLGGGLGYGLATSGTGAAIGKSVAVKFDFHSNSGEGNDSTGLYLDGATPTLPATNLTPTGLILASGDRIHAHIVYNGAVLTLTLADSSAGTGAVESYPVNIPAVVGGNTAYVGFTAASGGATAIQDILDWTYTVNPPLATTATPVITPGGGTFAAPTVAEIRDATPGAVIYYTTDGSTPTAASAVYSGPIAVNATENLQAVALANGDLLSAVASAAFTINAASVSDSAGFVGQSLALNGGATIQGSLLQLTDGGLMEARSAFFPTRVNVQAFTTDFDFQLLKAAADGFTFTLQNQGPTALGSQGAGLGYGVSPTGTGASIAKSVAVKFDIHNNSGEGNDSTGIYLNGASPTLPATNLATTGIVLSSGDKIHAHITYDGTNLALTLTDATVNATFTASYPVNIPSAVGGSTAYVGFTAGTGSTSAVEDILDWTFASNAAVTATPTFSAASGTYAGSQTVSIADATPGATIYYTTNGSTPTTASNIYSAPLAVAATSTIEAIAIAPNALPSAVATASYTIQSPAPRYAAGFQAGALSLNGGASFNGTVLELTDGGLMEARSAFFSTPVNVQAFTTDFDFQLLKAAADGFTFTLQNQGPTALGSLGGGLGYGPSAPNTGAVIAKSVAVKFDIHSNSGEGTDSTGIYLNGASPTVPSTNLIPTGIVLSSGDKIHAHLAYDGTNLTLTLTDATANATATEIYPVNIPSVVGGNTAYVGFTAGTGGSSSVDEILDWSFTP